MKRSLLLLLAGLVFAFAAAGADEKPKPVEYEYVTVTAMVPLFAWNQTFQKDDFRLPAGGWEIMHAVPTTTKQANSNSTIPPRDVNVIVYVLRRVKP
jgi:hypothetical protein